MDSFGVEYFGLPIALFKFYTWTVTTDVGLQYEKSERVNIIAEVQRNSNLGRQLYWPLLKNRFN